MNPRKLLCLVSLGALLAVAHHAAARPIKQPLHPTAADKNAKGRVIVSIHRAGKTMQGKMRVVGHHLSRNARFGVSVASVRIGTFTTDDAGSGVARFSSQPSRHAQFLGVDPRGKLLEVTDDQGEDVMETEMPDDTEPGDIRCCLTDDDQDGTECDETSSDECTAKNGTNMGAGSCFPDPCQTTSTPSSEDIVCCVSKGEETEHDGTENGGTECDETSAANCAAENGINMGAGSCEPDPCASSAVASVVQCCVSEDDADDQDADTDPPDCEELTATDCTAANGTALGTGSCDPNPCSAPTTTTTTTTMP